MKTKLILYLELTLALPNRKIRTGTVKTKGLLDKRLFNKLITL